MPGPELRTVRCKTALSRSRLPGLDWALNPYRGCAHSCAYCYAQDVTRFETARPWGGAVEAKVNIVQVLRGELRAAPGGVVGLGTVTDPYQPAESRFELTRGCLSVLRSRLVETSVLTKSPLVLRDLDILRGWRGAEVGVSISSVDPRLSSVLEPGAPAPEKRMAALEELTKAGVRTYLMAAPVIPGLCDDRPSLSDLISCASSAGVRRVIWDMYNPKPLAQRRLREALVRSGLLERMASASRDDVSARLSLEELCRAHSIELVYAF